MIPMTCRSAFAALSGLLLAACGQAAPLNESSEPTQTYPKGETVLTEVSLGDADAPIVIVEYASWTCPACLQFHEDVIPMLKSDYIETGKVRLVFREFPTAPASLSIAGFALARCSGEENYYRFIDSLFAAQEDVLNLARAGGDVEKAVQDIAKTYSITGDTFTECLADSDIIYAISDAVMKGEAQGVSSTPTVFINDVRLAGSSWRSEAGMRDILDTRLAELGSTDDDAVGEVEPASEADPIKETTTTETMPAE